MKKAASYLRLSEWIDSKVPLMLGVVLFFHCIDPSVSLAGFLAYFAYVSMFLAISYVVNDYSDIDADISCGKKKVIATVPRAAVWASIAAMFVLGNLPILLVVENKLWCGITIFVTYLLGLAYSVPPIRFKEKGVWGLIECAFAQRCMPLFVLPFLCRIQWLSFALLTVISFLNGLRYILIHQYCDRANDAAAGIKTYVTSGAKNVRSLIIGCFAAELLLNAVALVPLAKTFPVLLLGLLPEIVLEYSAYKVLHDYAGKDWLTIFDSVPLDGYYNLVFPLIAGTGACLRTPILLIAVFLLLLLNAAAIPVKYTFVKIWIKSLAKGKRSVP